MPLIKANNISLAYDGRTVVDNLSFAVSKGDYLCVIGENGSGKSTLIKALLSLISPSSGSLEYGDGLSKNEIGYLPQQTRVQRDFPSSVFETVISGCQNRLGFLPFYTTAHKKKALDALRILKAENLKNTCYHELSGGQQQRVLLARAMCATDKLLILDEPTAGLDPIITEDFYSVINDINKSGITIIMVSHDIEAVSEYATHILHLTHSGYIFDTADNYKKSKYGKIYLGGDADD